MLKRRSRRSERPSFKHRMWGGQRDLRQLEGGTLKGSGPRAGVETIDRAIVRHQQIPDENTHIAIIDGWNEGDRLESDLKRLK